MPLRSTAAFALVVAPDATRRNAYSLALDGLEAVKVVGVAPNLSIAKAKLDQLSPEVLVVDESVIDGRGLDFLWESRPPLPVVIVGEGSRADLERPRDLRRDGALERLSEALLAVLRRRIPDLPVQRRKVTTRTRPRAPSVVQLLAIGASTGGPNALAVLLGRLPAELPVPVVITQHLPAEFAQSLARQLDAGSQLDVKVAEPGDRLTPGRVLLAPGDRHLLIGRDGAHFAATLDDGPPENSCRPAVDPMFRSACERFGASTLAVVLTGMGADGLRGSEAIHNAGGQVLVQDEQSSVVWGMPGFIARAGLADAILPLPDLAAKIVRCVALGRPGPQRSSKLAV